MTFSIETAILDYLSKQDEPKRKQNIADNISYTIGSIKNATPRLVKAGYIAESRGYYVITSLGRKQLEADPFFTTRPKKSDKKIVIEIPIDELTVLEQYAIRETIPSQLTHPGELRLMAILFAVAQNIPMPKIGELPPPSEAEVELHNRVNKFLSRGVTDVTVEPTV